MQRLVLSKRASRFALHGPHHSRFHKTIAPFRSHHPPYKHSSTRQQHSTPSPPLRWGLFGDIHFQDRGLQDVVSAGDFIIDAFVRRNVSSVVALGDILNTRESVSVQALASAFEFFERLGNAIPGHVHIILGNHDMNLKHSGRVSSLDALSMTPMRDKFRLYRDMQVTEIDGRRAVMLPYQEHQTLIRDWVEQMSHEHALHEMTAFGHLSVNGAIQRYQADNAGNVYLRKYVEGDREHGERALGNNTSNNNGSGGSRSGNGSGGGGSGAVNVSSARVIRGNRFNVQQQRVSSMKRQSHALPSYLNAMKRVFTGHFHHHHVLGEDGKVVYCGAPLQHHFGDSGDFGRGVIVYEPDSDKFEFVQNPAWDVFRTVRVSSEADLEPVSQYKGKRVSVIYENLHLVPDKIQSLLLDNGAAEVKKHSISVKRVSSSIGAVNDAIPAHERDNNTTSVDQHDINHIQNLEDFVDHYVALYDISEPTFSQKLVTLGKQIIRECSAKHNLNRSSSKTFDARLKSLTIENFLGVQGVLHFDFESMEDGIWFLQGVNGSGKSTLLEAISWCLFDSFLRTDMKAGFAVNDIAKKNCSVRLEFVNGIAIERFRKYSAAGSVDKDSIADNISSTIPKKRGTGVRVFDHGVYQPHFEKGSMRDSQRAIEEELLGIDFDTFSKSVVLGDNITHFITSGQSHRRETIEKLLGLDKFEYFLQEARELKKQNGILRAETTTKIALIKEEVKQHRSKLDQITQMTKESDLKLLSLTEDSKSALQQAIEEMESKKQRVQQQLTKLSQLWEQHKTSVSEARLRKLQEQQLQQHTDKLAVLKSELASQLNHKKVQFDRINIAQDQDDSPSIEKLILTVSQEIADIEASIAQLRDDKIQLDVSKGTNANEIKRLTEVMDEHQCQYCGQEIEEDTHHKMKQKLIELQRERKQLQEKESDIVRSYQSLQTRLQSLKSHVDILNDVKTRMYHIDREVERLQLEIVSQNKLIMEAESKLAELTGPQDVKSLNEWKYNVPYPEIEKRENEKLKQQEIALMKQRYESDVERKLLDEKVKQKNHELLELRENIKSLEDTERHLSTKLELQQQQQTALEFWEKAFDKRAKKIGIAKRPSSAKQESDASADASEEHGMITMRSYLLDKSIEELNVIFSEYMQFLANQQQDGVETMKEEEDLRDSLNISFDADLSINEEYAKRSSGQRRRNHLCVFFGLFELVRQHSSFRSQFLMLDEIFDGLDHDGQLATVNLIQLLATRVEKVFIITHSPYMLHEFRTNQIIAEMTPNGSSYRIVSH